MNIDKSYFKNVYKSLLIISISYNFSYANMQIYPLRVHITPDVISGSLTIRNKDVKKNNYVIKTVYFDQTSEGKLAENLNENIVDSVQKIVRYSPRSFILEPNGEQVVRVMAKVDKRLEPGDYRGHLRFSTEEVVSQDDANEQKTVALNLKANIAMSIPVLYRIEPFEKKLELNNFKINLESKSVTIQLKRISKNYFPYGRLVVYTKKGKEKVELLQINGVQCFNDVLNFTYNYDSVTDSSKLKDEVYVDFIDTFADKEVLIVSSSTKI